MSRHGGGASLTIVVPTKDRPDFLPLAVASALRATNGTDSCVIVVDDGSARPARDCLADLDDPRLRVVENPGPHGPGAARNFGVASARTELILFLDDDDLLMDGYPAAVLAKAGMPDAPDYGSCAIASFTTGQEPVPMPVFSSDAGRPFAGLSPRKRLAGLGCGFWIRRDLFARIGGIDTQLQVNEDTDFSLRLLGVGARGWRFDAAGVLVRQHDRSAAPSAHQTHRHGPAQRADWFGLILARHAAFLDTCPKLRVHLQKRRLSMLAKAGAHGQARAMLQAVPAFAERLSLAVHYRLACLGARLRG